MTRSGPRLLSPVADRDLLVFAALLVLAAVVMVVTVLLVLAAGMAAALLGAPVQLTPGDGWLATGVRILADADCQVPGLVEAGLSPADALPDGVVGVVERLVLSGWDEAEFAV
jgi:hypothetical protein